MRIQTESPKHPHLVFSVSEHVCGRWHGQAPQILDGSMGPKVFQASQLECEECRHFLPSTTVYVVLLARTKFLEHRLHIKEAVEKNRRALVWERGADSVLLSTFMGIP